METNKNIINIDKDLCTGCRRCSEVCPVNAIEGKQGNPQSINRDVMCTLWAMCSNM